MRLWPPGMLTDLRTWCNVHETFLILDEVMTGFGRTGRHVRLANTRV
jgi:adenosylmethionine-8-amino-7-oxononanoate aminotransferase